MSQFRSIYCIHCGQTLLSDNLEKCSGCGKVGGLADAADPAALAALAAQKQPAPSQPPGYGIEVFRTMLGIYRLIGLSIVGAIIIGLGVYLLTNPNFRTDPRVLSISDAEPGIAAVFVGLIVIVLAIVRFIFRMRRSLKTLEKKDQATQTTTP